MKIKFYPFGATQEKLDQLLKLGLKYDKRQKRQMLAAANVVLPTEENVDDFERKIGIKLPADYRIFLIENNGGLPDKSIIKIPSLGKKVVQSFFALVSPMVDCTLTHNDTLYRGRVPNGMLPIADDPAGNLYLLRLKVGDDFGSVHFWEHEQEADGESQPCFENIKYIADSFSEFVSKIN